MASSRNKYHYAIRTVRKRSKVIRAQKLLDASNAGNCELLAEMKCVKGSTRGAQSVPEKVDGALGHEEIQEIIRQDNSDLYNSAGTEEAMIDLKEVLRGMIGPESLAEVDKITG